jgi:hypothetical protein
MNKWFILILFLLPLFSNAQVISDARLWTSFTASKKVEKFEFSLSHETRFDENISHIDKSFLEAGVDYKITKNVYGLFKYRFSRDNDYETRNYDIKNRLDLGLNLKYKHEKFRFGLRTKYQTKSANSYENNPAFWRNKFAVRYKVKDLTPFISYEFFYQFNEENIINRTRLSFGGKYSMNKSNAIKLFYIYENRFNTTQLKHNHIYGVSYNIEI